MKTPAKHLSDLHGQDIEEERRHDRFAFANLSKAALTERHEVLHDADEWNTAAERHTHDAAGFVRKAMKQSRTPINPVSDRQRDFLDDYHAKREVALEEVDNRCQAQLYGCMVVATETHHKAGRLGEDANTQLLPVCRSCHQQITEHKVNDYELGLSIRRNAVKPGAGEAA